MLDKAGTLAIIPVDMEPYGTMWSDATNIDHIGPIRTKQDPLGPYWTVGDHIFHH